MTHLQKLEVQLEKRSYPIYVGPDLLRRADLLAQAIVGRDVLLVTNSTVGVLYSAVLREAMGNKRLVELALPDGEQYKTLDTAARIWDALVDNGFHRDATVVALGGGVVGDIAGFAAACYQRGVAYVQVPTTLLAQVDSAVGGKTGVNHPNGKNLIGAFHQPVCVIADTNTLASLDDRQYRAGLAEVIKYGLILDSEFLDWIGQNMDALLNRDPESLIHAITCSCATKARIVAEDEREHGARALLNLGHTFGHAIETASGYGDWLHGEAVAAGMCMATRMSKSLGFISEEDVALVETIVRSAGLPIGPPDIDSTRMLELMRMDKKVAAGKIRLVLLERVGKALVTDDYSEYALIELLEHPQP